MVTKAKHGREITMGLLIREMSLAARQVVGLMCAGRSRQAGTGFESELEMFCAGNGMYESLLGYVSCKE